MKTIKVKPILISSNKRTDLAIVTESYYDITPDETYHKKDTLEIVYGEYVNLDYYDCKEIVLISDENIQENDMVTDGYDLCKITSLDNKYYSISNIDGSVVMENKEISLLYNGLSKVVALQSIIPKDYISKLIKDYNNGKMKEFYIEVKECLLDESFYFTEPILTDCYITIKEKSPNIYGICSKCGCLKECENKPLCIEQILPSIDDAGAIAVSISERIKPELNYKEQSLFIARFQECIKYLNKTIIKKK